MKVFLQSKLYLSFWLFTLKSAATVALTTLVGLSFGALLFPGTQSPPFEPSFFLLMCFIGIIVGFISSACAFVLIYAALQLYPKLSLRMAGLFTGLIAAAVTYCVFKQSGTVASTEYSFKIAVAMFLFPVGPFVLSLLIFIKLTHKYLNADARSHTARAIPLTDSSFEID